MAWDEAWEKVFREQEWGKYPAESVVQFIARHFYRRDRAATKILEIGCGPGANLWYLAREGFMAYGIDGSKTAIDRARQRLALENLSADLQVGDIVELPYSDAMFDGVIDIECLYANPRAATKRILAELRRVLKQGGLFYSRTCSDQMYIGKTREEVGPKEYRNISDGPFAGKGLARLSSRQDIAEIYGEFFNISSLDRLDYTVNNGSLLVSEWVVIAERI